MPSGFHVTVKKYFFRPDYLFYSILNLTFDLLVTVLRAKHDVVVYVEDAVV